MAKVKEAMRKASLLLVINEILYSAVGSPHHFSAKSVEKDVIRAFYYFNAIVSSPDCEAGCFLTGFATAVNCNQEIVAATFYI